MKRSEIETLLDIQESITTSVEIKVDGLGHSLAMRIKYYNYAALFTYFALQLPSSTVGCSTCTTFSN